MFVVHADYMWGIPLRKLWHPFELLIWFSVLYIVKGVGYLGQCFLTAGPWYQLYRAARDSPGICHFSFLSNFHE